MVLVRITSCIKFPLPSVAPEREVPVGFLSTVISAWDCLQRKHPLGQQPSQITCGWELCCPTVGPGVSWSGSPGL